MDAQVMHSSCVTVRSVLWIGARTDTILHCVRYLVNIYVCNIGVFCFCYKFCFFLFVPELFEVGPRPAAMALGSLSNWAGNFLVGMTFPLLQSSIGPYSFLLFATSTGCLCLFIKSVKLFIFFQYFNTILMLVNHVKYF